MLAVLLIFLSPTVWVDVIHGKEKADVEKAMKAIGDPAIRRMYADAILRICDREQEAAAHIKHQIERC